MTTPPGAAGRPAYDPASRRAILSKSGRVTTDSVDAGWGSLLLMARERDGATARDTTEADSLPTPDQSVVVTVGGDYELECFSNGVWRRSVCQHGVGGLTPGGVTDRLRIRSRGPAPMRSVHVFLPTAVFDEAIEHFRRVGTPHRGERLNAMGFRDPAITQAVVGLVRAVDAGAPDLYAATVGQYLATHLLAQHSPWRGFIADARVPGQLTDRRLARVLEYMSAHYQEPLALDQLAREAAISKFHFARLFRAATGEAPHAHLVRLRMRAARQLLGGTDLSVTEVAAAVGYGSAAHFIRAFTRAAGRSPLAYRMALRGERPAG